MAACFVRPFGSVSHALSPRGQAAAVTRPTVGVTARFVDSSALELLAASAAIRYLADATPAAMTRLLAEADALLISPPARVTAKQIAAAPRLAVIAANGSGVDNIDVAAALERGIAVVSGAGLEIPTKAVAEYVIGAMVLGQRQLWQARELFAATTMRWSDRFGPLDLRGHQLEQTKLGLVGYGHIGRDVATKAIGAFNAEVIVYDPYLNEPLPPPLRHVEHLNDLLDESDIVSIHTPLLPTTRGMIGAEELQRIGPHGLLINAARGGIIDEAALATALQTGQLGAAVIDVLENEPPTTQDITRLTNAPNLFLTPHIAGQTHAANAARERNAVQQTLTILAQHTPTATPNTAQQARSPS
jgi:phosphoglycerate dehydrogenase-like enzyme